MYSLILIGINTITSTPDCSRLRMVKRPYSDHGVFGERYFFPSYAGFCNNYAQSSNLSIHCILCALHFTFIMYF